MSRKPKQSDSDSNMIHNATQEDNLDVGRWSPSEMEPTNLKNEPHDEQQKIQPTQLDHGDWSRAGFAGFDEADLWDCYSGTHTERNTFGVDPLLDSKPSGHSDEQNHAQGTISQTESYETMSSEQSSLQQGDAAMTHVPGREIDFDMGVGLPTDTTHSNSATSTNQSSVAESGDDTTMPAQMSFISPGRVRRVHTVPTPLDVLMGRGEQTNHHPGNMRWRQERDKLQKKYRATDRNMRKPIAVCLARIVHAWGGSFLEKDSKYSDTWSEADDNAVVKKCQHALREKDKRSFSKRKKAPVSTRKLLPSAPGELEDPDSSAIDSQPV